MCRVFASLRTRLLLFVFLAFFPVLGLTLYTATEQRHQAAIAVQREALRLARLSASSQERLVEGARQLLIALAQVPSVRNHDDAACAVFIADVLRQYPLYENLGVAEPDGDIFCSAVPFTEKVNMANRSYFQRVFQTRDFVVGEYLSACITDEAVIPFAYPVLDELDEISAVVFARIDLNWLNEFAAAAQLPEGSTLAVIDHGGTILVYYPDPAEGVGKSVSPSMRQLLLGQGEGVAEAIGAGGVSYLYAFTPLCCFSKGNIYVRIGMPKTVAFAEANRILTRNLIALGLIALLVFGMAWVGGDVLVLRRVNGLLSVTKRLSSGDLSARTGLPCNGGELSQLACTFDQMAETLEARENECRHLVEELYRHNVRTEALARFAGCLNAQLELKSMLNAVCEETARALDVPAACVVLHNEDKSTTCCAAGHGLPLDFSQRVLPPLRTLYEQCGQQREPVVVADVMAFPDLPGASLLATLDIRSLVCAPMITGGELVGSLYVFAFGEVRPFMDDDLTLLETISEQAALAITKARLYAALQREVRARAALLEKTIAVQEDERKRIARELHDETSQSLSALALNLDTTCIALATGSQEAGRHLQMARSIAEGMLGNIHRLINDLRPSLLDDLGLVPAVTWYGEQRLKPHGIVMDFQYDGVERRLPSVMETALFRIAQEALTNVVRHADASRVSVSLQMKDSLVVLSVEDDGKGFDMSATGTEVAEGSGMGLQGIRERVNILGGELRIQSGPGEGTHITVCIPLSQEEVNGA